MNNIIKILFNLLLSILGLWLIVTILGGDGASSAATFILGPISGLLVVAIFVLVPLLLFSDSKRSVTETSVINAGGEKRNTLLMLLFFLTTIFAIIVFKNWKGLLGEISSYF